MDLSTFVHSSPVQSDPRHHMRDSTAVQLVSSKGIPFCFPWLPLGYETFIVLDHGTGTRRVRGGKSNQKISSVVSFSVHAENSNQLWKSVRVFSRSRVCSPVARVPRSEDRMWPPSRTKLSQQTVFHSLGDVVIRNFDWLRLITDHCNKFTRFFCAF
jgi:hypothetical protein